MTEFHLQFYFDRESTQRVTVREKNYGSLKYYWNSTTSNYTMNSSLLTTLIPADFTLNIPVSRFTAFESISDQLYVKAENVTVAQN